MNDGDPEFSSRALLHQDRRIRLAAAIEVSAQIEGIYTKGELVCFGDRAILDDSRARGPQARVRINRWL
jgi:hypothetical protein